MCQKITVIPPRDRDIRTQVLQHRLPTGIKNRKSMLTDSGACLRKWVRQVTLITATIITLVQVVREWDYPLVIAVLGVVAVVRA